MNSYRPSIHLLVSLIVILPILVVSAALLALSSYTSNRIESELATALVRTTAGRVGMRVLHGIADAERTSALYTHRITARTLPPDPSPAYERLMYESMIIRPHIGSITYAWPDGRCIYVMRDGDDYVVGRAEGPGPGQMREYRLGTNGQAIDPPIRVSQYVATQRPWYKTAVSRENPSWTDVYFWFSEAPKVFAKQRIASVGYTRALRDGDELKGVLSIDVTLPQVSDVLRETEIAKLGSLFVVDESGRLLADSEGLSDELPAELPSIFQSTHRDAIAAASVLHLAKSSDTDLFQAGNRHVFIESLYPVSDLRWKLVMVMPRSNVTGQVVGMQRWSVIIGGMVVLGSLILGLLLAGIISRPIRQLASHVRTIGHGAFDKKISLHSTAEMRQLSNAVNDMTSQLHEQVALRTAKEAAERANEARSSFFNRVTHELRTPLNAIIGYTEMLEEKPAIRGDPETREDLRRVMQASRQLLTLINDLLDLARAESGKLRITWANVGIPDLVREVEETVRPMVEENGNSLETDLQDDGTPIITDRAKLRQILLNLLSNAAKFTRNGSIKLSVRRDASHLHFRVTDTGPGIPRDKMAEMFEPFAQATCSTEGTGLGLTICRQLTQLLGGEIELASEVGVGTTADVYLPIRAAPPTLEPALAASLEDE